MEPTHPPQRPPIDLPSLPGPPSTPSIHSPSSSRHSFVDKVASSPPSTMAPSRSFAEGAWEGRKEEYLLLEAPSHRYWSHKPSNQIPDIMGHCDFRIFELVNDQYSIPTRRIAIRNFEHKEQCESHCKTRWFIRLLRNRIMLIASGTGMPLDNVHIEIEDRQITMSWSACSHIFAEKRGYRTTFTCVSDWVDVFGHTINIGTQQYIPKKHNRKLVFECEDASGYYAGPM